MTLKSGPLERLIVGDSNEGFEGDDLDERRDAKSVAIACAWVVVLYFAHQLMLGYVMTGNDRFLEPQHLVYDDEIQYDYSVTDIVRIMSQVLSVLFAMVS